MSTRFLTALALVAALVVAPACAFAATKQVPTPDLSKLPAAGATELGDFRADFDAKRASLTGEPLAEAYAQLGAAYARYRFFDAASVALENASLLAPNDGRWVYVRGLVARIQKQEAVAQNFFELALRLDKEYLPIRMAVARAKLKNGDVEGARRLLAEYVASHTDQAAAYAFLGEIELRQKRYAEAITHAQRALALDPEATQVYATLADAQAGLGNAKAATEARSKAGTVAARLSDTLAEGLFGLSPAPRTTTDPTTKDLAEAARLLGLGQYDGARRRLDDALKRQPNEATVLALYARVDAAAGNLAAAKSRAVSAVAADKDSALAHLSHGVALEMSGDDSAARRAYETAVRLDPKLVEARALLGTLLMRTGRNEEAITQYRELVRLHPRNREHWMRLVAAYVVAGRCTAALRDVSEMLGLDDKNKFMLEVFVRLASTCPAASAKERLGALEYGGKLYGENATASVSEAYALALAANGRWDEAVKTQQAAMFMFVRGGLKDAMSGHRELLEQLQAHKMPTHPWPASAVLFHPQRLAPNPKPVAAPKKR
jgi:tetratricopeptide (TPR) repeat protein